MDQLHRQVKRAYSRLLLQSFFRSLPVALALGLLWAAILIGVDKLAPLGLLPQAWLAIGAGLGLLGAIGWTFWSRRGVVDAAIEIDRRFGLKERVSSALALDDKELESPAGQALIIDAERRISQIEVSDQFRVRLDRWFLLPVVPAAIAIAVAMFVPPWAPKPAAASVAAVQLKKQLQNSAKELQKKNAELKREAEKLKLKDAQELLTKIEQTTQRDLTKSDVEKKQALVKLNDLSKQLDERRQKLANSESFKQQLNGLKDLNRGPADKLAEALKQGDVKQALEELKKLQQQVADGKLSPESREQLANQLSQMQDKLNQMAAAQQQAMEQLEKQIAEKRAAGKENEAAELEEKLAQMKKNAPQNQQMQKLAQQLAECSQCMKDGDSKGAGEKMAEMQAGLEQLGEEMAESELLTQAMDEIQASKDSMNCKSCQGMGCAQCQSVRMGQSAKPGGSKAGWGHGYGPRPDDIETRSYDSTVKQKVGRGPGEVVDFVEGPNLKGGVQQEITAQVHDAKQQDANPLTGQRLPKSTQEHAKEYFDALREGK